LLAFGGVLVLGCAAVALALVLSARASPLAQSC